MSTGPFLIQFAFASIGLLISTFIVKTKAVYPVAIGISMGTYFLGITATISDKMEFLKYFSFYQYIAAEDIVKNVRIGNKLSGNISCSINYINSFYFYKI